MDERVITLPIAGVLDATTTPDDLERSRRRAAYWHCQQAIGLWPWLEDLQLWLEVAGLEASPGDGEALP